MKNDEKTILLKKAKKAVFWNFLFNRPIAHEYHCLMVNLECCSERQLKHYFRDYRLCVSAQVLMVEKYVKSNPALIASYIRAHNWRVSKEMQIKIVESKNANLLKRIACLTAGHIGHFEFDECAVTALINLNNVKYFSEALEYGLLPKKFGKASVTAVIETQNPEFFDFYLQYVRKNDIAFWNLHQKILYEQNNSAMIDCFLKYMSFDANILCDIITTEDTVLFAKLIKKDKLTSGVELFLAKSGSKKMLAQYIKQRPLSPEAQIELIKWECKDILKLHYLKHNISQQALLYLQCLSHFKEYIDI